MSKIITTLVLLFALHSLAHADNGKKIFETYCWGCHHQTAVAFGPSFSQIAAQRTAEEIQGMITDPASVSKHFGYKRNAMPAFTLTAEELKAITDYILSFKDADPSEPSENREHNGTKAKEPYPNIATNKESK